MAVVFDPFSVPRSPRSDRWDRLLRALAAAMIEGRATWRCTSYPDEGWVGPHCFTLGEGECTASLFIHHGGHLVFMRLLKDGELVDEADSREFPAILTIARVVDPGCEWPDVDAVIAAILADLDA